MHQLRRSWSTAAGACSTGIRLHHCLRVRHVPSCMHAAKKCVAAASAAAPRQHVNLGGPVISQKWIQIFDTAFRLKVCSIALFERAERALQRRLEHTTRWSSDNEGSGIFLEVASGRSATATRYAPGLAVFLNTPMAPRYFCLLVRESCVEGLWDLATYATLGAGNLLCCKCSTAML